MNYLKSYENMREKNKKLMVTGSAQQRGAQICNHKVKVKWKIQIK